MPGVRHRVKSQTPTEDDRIEVEVSDHAAVARRGRSGRTREDDGARPEHDTLRG
jgi:hypothetical protein